MSNKNNPLIVSMILLTALLCFANSSMAAEPVELENLRESFTTAKQNIINESHRKEIINIYIQQLTDLATDLRIYEHDIAGANMVRREIRKAKKELDADPADQAAPSRPVIAEPAPKPVVQKPEPKPVAVKPAPEPVVQKPEPDPVAAKPVPKPEPKPLAKPAVAKPTPKPIITKPAPMLLMPVRAAKPIVVKPTKKPVVQKKPAPKPVVAKPTLKPTTQKKPAPKPPVMPKPNPSIQKNPAPKPVAAKQVPNPAPKQEHIPQTHVSSIQGLAGNATITKNNVYTFNLPGIGSSTILAFWATGRSSIDTYGKVWLITPEGRRIIVGIWKESYFTQPSTEITSFYRLKPITEDITRKVSEPGTYKVEFEWTDGNDPLVIYRVEITS